MEGFPTDECADGVQHPQLRARRLGRRVENELSYPQRWLIFAGKMIALDSAESIPPELRARLKRLLGSLLRDRYVDSFARTPEAQAVMAEMNDYLESRSVVGIHYTRANPHEIERGGLTCGPGANRRKWFLNEFGHHFSRREIEAIKSAWRKRYDAHENSLRDHRVFFNFTRSALTNGGATPLLENFGGETIYMGLLDLPDILAKSRSFGSPLIVRCRLKISALQACWEFPAALVWLSAYHVAVNPHARLYDVDVFSPAPIPPEDILSIETATAWV